MNLPGDSRWFRVTILLVAGLAMGSLVALFLPSVGSSEKERSDSKKSAPSAGIGIDQSLSRNSPLPESESIDKDLMKMLGAAVEYFSEPRAADVAESKLRALGDQVAAMDPTLAAETLIAFLGSGADAATGLGFQVGPGGILSTAPSLRVAALDWLGRTGSPLATDNAVDLMDTTSDSSEYAVALRNFAWGSNDNAEIGGRFSDMLDRNEWLENPDGGFMEAFDVAVSVGGPQMVRELGSLVIGDDAIADGLDPVLNHPAFIALDRIMLRDPAAVVEVFESDPEFLSWAPSQRASLMSRVDLADAAQREMLERYLLSGRLMEPEIEYFANIFPNVNGIDNYRMVTTSEEIRNANVVDQTTRQVIEEWQSNPRFLFLKPALERIQQRIGP